MITHIGPEPGGEAEGILRVEISMPMAPEELRSLQWWFNSAGWSIEDGQVDDWFDNLSFTCPSCSSIGNVDDGIDPSEPRCPRVGCGGAVLNINPYEVNA